MRRLLLVLFVALLLGAGSYQLLENNSGYLLLVLNNTSITMNIWFAGLIVGASLLAVWFVVWLIRSGFKSTGAAVSRVFFGHERRAQRRTSRGLIDFMEGNWKNARRQLLKAAPKAETPLVNYLAAARSAYELGDEQQASKLLHKAESMAPESSLAVALTQARMQLLDKKYEQCAATLQRAQQQAPKHPVVLDLLYQVYIALQDWDALEKMLQDLRRYQVVSGEALDELTAKVYHNLLQSDGERAVLLSAEAGLKRLQKTWLRLPKAQQKSPQLLAEYVAQLRRIGADKDAEVLLRKSLQQNWSSEAILAYGQVQGGDLQKQLLVAESWLKERPANAALLLTLGRLCLRNQLWGKARDYFENSLRLEKQGQTYAELARLLANLGEHELSTEYYQHGLLMMTEALPELPQPHMAEGASN
ncbi:heme biosynthesis protein HemY [Maricurvus nonylphenolicus]|uniref:heme biosynthesis HemY N-terminal domain-containing protein n=1 Tax=Maricurvus nonylphenolicus TaxID=1008307 RepID=UPI0036F30E47